MLIALFPVSICHLIQTYSQKIKSAEPVVRTVRNWTSEVKQELQDCFDSTDWSVFETAATNLSRPAYTGLLRPVQAETISMTSYNGFCVPANLALLHSFCIS